MLPTLRALDGSSVGPGLAAGDAKHADVFIYSTRKRMMFHTTGPRRAPRADRRLAVRALDCGHLRRRSPTEVAAELLSFLRAPRAFHIPHEAEERGEPTAARGELRCKYRHMLRMPLTRQP